MKNIILVIVYFSLTIFQAESVIKGTDTTIKEYPYIVSLQNIYGEHQCGGVILTEKFVLTSAQCQFGSEWAVEIIVAGISDLQNLNDSMIQQRKIKEFMRHEDYTGGPVPDDIALILLDEPFVFNQNIQPIKLGSNGKRFDYKTDQTTILGWGMTNDTTKDLYPDVLQKANLQLMDPVECQKSLSNFNFDLKKNLCTEPDLPIFCVGDSGSPLVYKNGSDTILIGIASWVFYPCTKPIRPSVFVNVSYYINWIKNKVQTN